MNGSIATDITRKDRFRPMEDIERKDLRVLCALCLASGFLDIVLGLLFFLPLVVIGAAFVVVAIGCKKLAKEAWYAAIAVSIISVIATVLTIPFPFGLVPLIFGALVLYYLYKSDVKPLFFIDI